MIRGSILVLVCLFFVSACANGTAVRSLKIFSPAEFQITDINVDFVGDVDNRAELRRLMQFAATNLALAYNERVVLTAPQYVMEISVQAAKFSPTDEAVLKYQTIVRNENDGTEFRSLPVVITNMSGKIERSRIKKGLIENSMPEAFYRLYGLAGTPESVQSEVAGEALFADPFVQNNLTPTAYSQPVETPAPTNTPSQTSGDPKVIQCAVC